MGRKATPAQLAALAKGRAVLRARRKKGLARRGPAKKKAGAVRRPRVTRKRRGAGFWGDAWEKIKGAGRGALKEATKEGKKRLLEVAKSKLGGGVRRRVVRRKRAGGTAVGGAVKRRVRRPRVRKKLVRRKRIY